MKIILFNTQAFYRENPSQTIYSKLRYIHMEPFNIKINSGDKPVSLTILPIEKGYYKVIYYASILTALENTGRQQWLLKPKDDIEAGDLPFYIPGQDDERLEIALDADFVTQVGAAIEEALKE